MELINNNNFRKMILESPGLKIGNDIYNIEFTQKKHFPKYGAKYTFSLVDSVDSCPEYLVNLDVLSE